MTSSLMSLSTTDRWRIAKQHYLHCLIKERSLALERRTVTWRTVNTEKKFERFLQKQCFTPSQKIVSAFIEAQNKNIFKAHHSNVISYLGSLLRKMPNFRFIKKTYTKNNLIYHQIKFDQQSEFQTTYAALLKKSNLTVNFINQHFLLNFNFSIDKNIGFENLTSDFIKMESLARRTANTMTILSEIYKLAEKSTQKKEKLFNIDGSVVPRLIFETEEPLTIEQILSKPKLRLQFG